MNKHTWVKPMDIIKYPFCKKCLIIKRKDNQNGPCKGPTTIRIDYAKALQN